VRFLVATAHFFAPTYRDAGMHRFAKALAAKGHHVDFITVGQSWLKQRIKSETRIYAAAAEMAAATGTNPPNIHAHVHAELFHPPSGSPRANRITVALERRYGRTLDAILTQAATNADIVILECGYPLYYFEAIRRLNAHAKYLAFYNDRLDLVGFRPELLALHERLMPRFDLVRTNAERLLDYLPDGANGIYIPQGVDKQNIRFDCPSPYASGTRNIVSVGNMLFDEAAVREIAAAAATHAVDVHVIGARMDKPPANVIVHGELVFARTLPFIVHADVGLAPYRAVAGADYLVQSSLKIQQYSYCGLPVLLARGLDVRGDNFVYYDRGIPGDVDDAVERALAMQKKRAYGHDLLGWDEVGDRLLEAIQSIGAGQSHSQDATCVNLIPIQREA
jgi:2-beta-glucuronyltransferase